jgi:hypothetical protein
MHIETTALEWGEFQRTRTKIGSTDGMVASVWENAVNEREQAICPGRRPSRCRNQPANDFPSTVPLNWRRAPALVSAAREDGPA